MSFVAGIFLGFLTLTPSLWGQEQGSQASLPSTNSSVNRRSYPGGRDDSDLTVQPFKKITVRGEDLDPEQVESDAREEAPQDNTADFGE